MGPGHKILQGTLGDCVSDRVWEKPLGIKEI